MIKTVFRTNKIKGKVMLFAIALISILCFCISLNSDLFVAKADVDNFVMVNGASIRINSGSIGIKFEAELDETYFNSIKTANENKTVKVFSIVNTEGNAVHGTSSSLEMEHKDLTAIDGKISLNATVKYDNLTEEQKIIASRVDLEVNCYIVIDDDWTNAIKASACENVRCMRAVANAALSANEVTINQVGSYISSVTSDNTVKGVLAENDLKKLDFSEVYEKYPSYDTVYMGAKKLGKINDKFVTLSENFDVSGKVIGDSFDVSVMNAQNDIVNLSLLYCTKIIKTKEDLQTFVYTANKKLEGLYVMTGNIDAIDYTFTQTSFEGITDRSDNSGFAGTFDGRGYVISGLKIDGPGLFGNVCSGATIKNVALNNLQFTDYENVWYNCSYVLARNIQSQWNNITNIQNCYINSEKLPISNYKGYICYTNTVYTKFENVIIESSDTEINDKTTSFKGAENSDQSVLDSNNNYFKDVYVLSSIEMVNGIADAKNVYTSERKYYENVKRYVSSNEMINDLSNDYASFSSLYWNTNSYGYPVWNAIADSYIEVNLGDFKNGTVYIDNGTSAELTICALGNSVSANEISVTFDDNSIADYNNRIITAKKVGATTVNITFVYNGLSVKRTFDICVKAIEYTGKILFSSQSQQLSLSQIKTIFGDEATKLTSVKDGVIELLSDGKITGIQNYTNSPIDKTVTATADNGEVRTIKLTVYTSVFYNEDDYYEIFPKDGTGDSATGCYIVADEVIYLNIQSSRTWGKTNGLSGLFDGNGKKIYAKVSNHGLFGTPSSNAVVQNVAFVDVELSGSTSVLFWTCGYGVTIKDVFVSVKSVGNPSQTGGLIYNLNVANTVIENVIIEYPEKDLTTEGGTISQSSFAISSVNNVVIISKTKQLNCNKTTANFASQSDANSFEYTTEIIVSGVSRYDDITSYLGEDESKNVGKWQINIDGVIYIG